MTDWSAPDTPPSPDIASTAPASKTPAPPLMARAPRPGAVRIRKPFVMVMAAAAALLVAGSLTWAFVIEPGLRTKARAAAADERPEAVRGGIRPSDRVTDQPSTYDRLGDEDRLPAPRLPMNPAAEAPVDPAVSAPARIPTSTYAPARPDIAREPSPAEQAAASGLFFAGTAGAPMPAAQAVPSARAPSQAARDQGAVYSPHGLTPPLSPYELKAGAIVPGVLLTAVDTARPGPVVATVTQNVFDSITGRHLVIPQGTRLIGRHEGESAHGQSRAFLVWDRMILPNGSSLLLNEAPGVDGQGSVGLAGRTDRRLWPLGIASLLAGAITTFGELARGGADRPSFVAGAGDAASIQAAEVGGRLIDRELIVRPSIRVRAGAPVRVMITRDLILEPYRP